MVFPTLFSLGGLTLVVLTKDLLGYTELVINRGLPVEVVGWIAFYQTLPLASKMVPFAAMVGILVALGRLGADREILVLEASGLSARRLVGPVVAFATAMSLLAFTLALWAAPWASRSLDGEFDRIARENPGLALRPAVISQFGQWKIEARTVSPNGRELGGVAMWFPRVQETIFAKRGAITQDDKGAPTIVLEEGAVMIDPRGKPRLMRFDTMRAGMPSHAQDPIRRETSDQLAGFSLSGLEARAADVEESAKDRRAAAVEWHRRFSLPAATILFGMLALPLFLSRAQFSRAGGGMLGVLSTVVYYGLVQLGNGFIQSETLSVALGVWLPNVIVFVFAVLLFSRLGRESAFARGARGPQGSRIGALFARLGGGGGSPDDGESQGEEGAATEPKIRVHRFALQRYVAGRFLQMALMVFLGLLVAYLMVDVLERLQWFAKYQATGEEAIRFYAARIPLLASRVIPMSLLVATALTVALLAVQGELMGIRSCGIPAPRALLPVLLLCGLVAPASFYLNNNIVPRSNAIADHLKQTEIKDKTTGRERANARGKAVWYRVGRKHYAADLLDPQSGVAQTITVYELDDQGLPLRRLDAAAAEHFGGGDWLLSDAIQVDIATEDVRVVEAPEVAELGEAVPADVDTMHLSIGELAAKIDDVHDAGYDATVYEVDFFVKLAAPFACLVLPALALFFCVSGPPYPSSALSLVLSAVIAVVYVLITGVGTSLGYGGALPPVVAGWTPTAFFAVLATVLGLRLGGMFSRH